MSLPPCLLESELLEAVISASVGLVLARPETLSDDVAQFAPEGGMVHRFSG